MKTDPNERITNNAAVYKAGNRKDDNSLEKKFNLRVAVLSLCSHFFKQLGSQIEVKNFGRIISKVEDKTLSYSTRDQNLGVPGNRIIYLGRDPKTYLSAGNELFRTFLRTISLSVNRDNLQKKNKALISGKLYEYIQTQGFILTRDGKSPVGFSEKGLKGRSIGSILISQKFKDVKSSGFYKKVKATSPDANSKNQATNPSKTKPRVRSDSLIDHMQPHNEQFLIENIDLLDSLIPKQGDSLPLAAIAENEFSFENLEDLNNLLK